jgi:hypothetical protein
MEMMLKKHLLIMACCQIFEVGRDRRARRDLLLTRLKSARPAVAPYPPVLYGSVSWGDGGRCRAKQFHTSCG